MSSQPVPMHYAFKLDETFQAAFTRIARHETELAIGLLEEKGSNAEAVHQTRKAIKRLRALLRLVRPSLTQERYKLENARLRDAAASLSGARDAEVMLRTLDLVGKRTKAKKFSSHTAEFREWLIERRDKQLSELDASALANTQKLLKDARDSLEILELGTIVTNDDDLAAGLSVMMHNARFAFTEAYRLQLADTFHEYRKSVQLYHRHMQLLQPAWPELINIHIDAAQTLSDILGDEHDLSVLHNAVHHHRKLFPNKQKLEVLVNDICEWQRELQSNAYKTGRRLFLAEEPEAFARRMAAYFSEAKAPRLEDLFTSD